MKSILKIGLISLLIVGLLAACGTGGGTQQEAAPADTATDAPAAAVEPAAAAEDLEYEGLTGVLTYWSCFSGDSMIWDQWRIDEFMAEFPGITVEAQFVPESAGINNGVLMAAIAGGTAPDLIIADDFVAAFGFAAQGAFEPWDPFLEAIDMRLDEFMPGFHGLMQFRGQTYLLPQDSNVIMMFLNVELVEAAGLDINDYPTNIEELNAWAEAMMIVNDDGSFQQMGMVPWMDTPSAPFFWPFMFGAELYYPAEGRIDITTQPVIDALEWQRGFAQAYNITQIESFAQAVGGLFSPNHPFYTGRLGIMIVGNWATNALRIYAPDVEYVVRPVPVPPGGRVESTTLGSNVFAMPINPDNPLLAATFVRFSQRAEINGVNFDQWRSIPTIDAIFDDVSWTIAGDEIYAMQRRLANSPQSGHPGLSPVAGQMQVGMEHLRDQVLFDDLDPLPLLETLQENLQAALDGMN